MRLTIDARRNIATKESNLKFDKLIDVAKKKMLDEIEKVYQKEIAPYKIPQKLIDDGFTGLTNSFRVGDKGYRRYYETNSSFPCKPREDHTKTIKDEKVVKLCDEYEDLVSQKTKFYSNILTILRGFSNHKKLIEAIPEFESYFEGALTQNTFAVIPVEKINAIRNELVKR